MNISFEDRNGRKGARFSGFSTPVPMTLESRRRKWFRVAGNSSQRMNLRFSPKRFDPVVVEGSQDDGRLSNPPSAD
jgi:hypothetical protein